MISKVLNFALVILTVTLIGNYFYRLPKYSRGNVIPDIALHKIDGSNVSLGSLADKTLLLHFWGSWCTSCRRENKELVKWYSNFQNKKDSTALSNFEIISIALERKEGNAVHAIAKDSLFWDNHMVELGGFSSPIAEEYGVKKIPTTYLIDSSRKVLLINPSIKQLDKYFNSL